MIFDVFGVKQTPAAAAAFTTQNRVILSAEQTAKIRPAG